MDTVYVYEKILRTRPFRPLKVRELIFLVFRLFERLHLNYRVTVAVIASFTWNPTNNSLWGYLPG